MIAENLPEGYIHTTFQRTLAVREQIAGVRPAEELKTLEDRIAQYNRLRGLVYSLTPVVADVRPNGSIILYKHESYRPSGSHYDPTYFETLFALEMRDKYIKPGDDLYEVTSGSAGTSFAWFCSRLGFKAHIYVPSSLPAARKQEMRNFGAILEDVGDENAYVLEASRAETRAFLRGARETGHRVDPIKNEDFKLFMAQDSAGHTMVLVNHSENGITPKAMEDLLYQVYVVTPEGTRINNIVSVIGNGSSSTGLYRARAKYFPEAALVGLENYDSAVLFREKYPALAEKWNLVYKPQRMYGSIIPGMKLPFLDHAMFDEIRLVKEKQMDLKMQLHNFGRPVIEWIGMSSAASMIVAEQLAAEIPGSVTLAFIYDGGYRYGEPVVPTGKFDETDEIQNYLRTPRCPFWFQAPARDLSSMPHSIGEAFHRVIWTLP